MSDGTQRTRCGTPGVAGRRRLRRMSVTRIHLREVKAMLTGTCRNFQYGS
jgi:hypothetical protein